MNCPRCESNQIGKNGYHYGEPSYVCQQCEQQVGVYAPQDYSDDAKQLCLRMYLTGMGLRGIELITGINYNTVTNWVSQAGLALPNAPESDQIQDTETTFRSHNSKIDLKCSLVTSL